LPGSSVLNGSLAPPLDVITRFPPISLPHCHMPGDRPTKPDNSRAIAVVTTLAGLAAG